MEHVPSTIKQVFSLNGGDEEAGSRFQVSVERWCGVGSSDSG
jgi:hypothetical protein